MALWLVLGWDLSYHKRQYNTAVNWIGYTIITSAQYVEAQIKKSFMSGFTGLAQQTLRNHVISKDELRSLAGKSNHISTLIYAWRPFLDQLWAAIADQTSTRSSSNKVWVKQIEASLSRLLTFLEQEPETLVRMWRFDFYSSPGILVSFSP